MMRIFPLFFIFFGLISACNATKEIGGSLSPDELAYLQEQARNECLTDTNGDYQDFIDTSNESIMDLARDDAWKLEAKKDNTVLNTNNIAVWKVDTVAKAVYFLVTVTSDSGVVLNKFYKVTTTTNSDMLKDLQYKKCSKAINTTINFSSSSIKLTLEADPVTSGTTKTDTQMIYTYGFKNAALFGFLTAKRTVKTLNADNNDAVTATSVWESIATVISSPTTQSSDLNTYANKRFCMLKYTPAVTADNIPILYSIPYTDDSACTDNISTPIDANGDGTADFNPATELVI